ncbi:hypothetical protein EVAR_44043_1 [Eumeta japonica]|uniref:Secreted protein n=1 Tax=Eumeta variegata TaxID=151549 RepID=A0A4C1XIQ8_EUMVA|nr:hypothetical protein EVAR_44043_1 [Eumeta japonica]
MNLLHMLHICLVLLLRALPQSKHRPSELFRFFPETDSDGRFQYYRISRSSLELEESTKMPSLSVSSSPL